MSAVEAEKKVDDEKKVEEKGGELLFCGGTCWDIIGRKKGNLDSNLVSPTRLRPLLGVQIRFVASGCASCHCVALDVEGRCYTWGRNEKGQLGHGDTVQRDRPTIVSELSKYKIIKAAGGKNHTVVVTENGYSLAFGWNKHGQLGSGSVKNEIEASPIRCLVSDVRNTACGGDFTVWLSSTEGASILTAGLPQYGQLGHGTDNEIVNRNLDLEISKQEAFRALVLDFIRTRSKKPVMEEGFVVEMLTDSAKGKKQEAWTGEAYQIVVSKKVAELKHGLIQVAEAEKSEEANIEKVAESHDEGEEKMKEEGVEAEIDELFQLEQQELAITTGQEKSTEEDDPRSSLLLVFNTKKKSTKNHAIGMIQTIQSGLRGDVMCFGAERGHWRCGIVRERVGTTRHLASLRMDLWAGNETTNYLNLIKKVSWAPIYVDTGQVFGYARKCIKRRRPEIEEYSRRKKDKQEDINFKIDQEYNTKDSSVKLAYEAQPRPKAIASLSGETIVKVACGLNHTVAADANGYVYTWGFGGYGRLGHREQKDEWSPRRVDVFQRNNVLPPDAIVAAGSVNSSCTAGGGQLYMWGKIKANGDDWMYPKPLMDLSGWNLRCMDSGNMHHFVGADNSCISWGQAQYGELGYGPAGQKSSATPKKVDILEGMHVIGVACGMGHSMIIVDRTNVEDRLEQLEVYDGKALGEVTEAPAAKPTPTKQNPKRGSSRASENPSKRKKAKDSSESEEEEEAEDDDESEDSDGQANGRTPKRGRKASGRGRGRGRGSNSNSSSQAKTGKRGRPRKVQN